MNIHFIGIGGIGVSALARYYLEKNYKISGSDLVASEITDSLKKLGAKIFIGPHKSENLPKDTDLVIYSPAIQSNNPELLKAINYKLKAKSYPEALGELTKQYYTIAVSGTHGKSTTAAMIGLLLVKADLDPSIIVGTKLKELGNSNCRIGKSQYLVIEADEHQASFLNYWPKIIALTNIEREHLDYYKNLRNILKTYKEYIFHLPRDGVLVANKDDKNISKFKIQNSKLQFKIKNYFLKQKEVEKLKKILKVPGEHNVSNALAALTTARILKIPDRISFRALSEYRGSWRRFEEKTIKLKTINYKLISDYAHHPTEVRVTLKAARERYLRQKIWCLFQPHQYQRTYYLFKDFVRVFQECLDKNWIEKLIMTDIYDVAGRENKKIKEKVNSKKMVEAIDRRAAIYLPKEKIIDSGLLAVLVGEGLRDGEVVIIMGAGDIYKLAEPRKNFSLPR